MDPASKAVYLSWAKEMPARPVPKGAKEADPLLQAVVARSDDGGKTFGQPVVASPLTDHVVSYTVSPTQVAVGPKGEVFVLYLHNDPDFNPEFEYGRSFLHLVRSEDGGKTFSPPVVVGSEDMEGAITSMEMANLFVAPSGDLHVSWLGFREEYAAKLAAKGKTAEKSAHEEAEEPPTQLRVARSSDGGRSFGPSALVSKPTCQCCGTKVAQGKAFHGPDLTNTELHSCG
ncbi:MAG: sialidase family protein [Acidimicrobiia bacterium]